MTYDETKLASLKALKDLAQRVNNDFAKKTAVEALSTRIDDIVSIGGEPNVITEVKVNGTALSIADKAVDVTVPTKVSDLTNDAKFQTEEQVAATVAAAAHLQRKIVDSVDDIDPTEDGAENCIYMVNKGVGVDGDQYDEYMVIDGQVEKVGNWEVDLSGYVQKETGKSLSTNDFTDADKEKLDGLENYTLPEASVNTLGGVMLSSLPDIDGDMKTKEENGKLFPVGNELGQLVACIQAADRKELGGVRIGAGISVNEYGTISISTATNTEVSNMLDEVFGTTDP